MLNGYQTKAVTAQKREYTFRVNRMPVRIDMPHVPDGASEHDALIEAELALGHACEERWGKGKLRKARGDGQYFWDKTPSG